MNLTISQHAKERYAERIMDKTHPTDIAVFVNENNTKINTDINKMIEYGKLVFSGKNETNKIMNVYINDLWIILVDSNKEKVITLFRIDLGVGDDFDKEFIERNLNNLKIAQEEFEIANKNIEQKIKDYTQIIKENEAQINEFRSFIKKLESQNGNYKEIVSNLKVNSEIALKKVNGIVATLIGKKSF